jgi:hypothetical protein
VQTTNPRNCHMNVNFITYINKKKMFEILQNILTMLQIEIKIGKTHKRIEQYYLFFNFMERVIRQIIQQRLNMRFLSIEAGNQSVV